MDALFKLAPLGALLLFAVIVVWRGLRRKPDSSKNSESGGGPGSF
jgi:hypothetical protein